MIRSEQSFESDDLELLMRIGSVLRETEGDILSLLERLGRALDTPAIVIVRPRRRSVIAECAWEGDDWNRLRVRVEDLTPPMLESLSATEAVQIAAEAAGVPRHFAWEAAWSATGSLAIGLAGTISTLSSNAVTILATSLEVLMARELSSVTSRIAAVLRERTRIALAVHEQASKECEAVGVRLDVLEGMLAEVSSPAQDFVAEIKTCTRTALKNLRTALFNMTPAPPSGPWSVDDLQQLVEDSAAAHELNVTFDSRGPGEVIDNGSVELVSTFVQEALANLHKQSRTNRGEVHVSFDHGSVQLSVRDTQPASDGDGVSNGSARPDHVIRLLRAWARLLGGDITLEPAGQDGMALRLDMPL